MSNDVHVVTGYGSLFNADNMKPGIDLKEIERGMINGGLIQKSVRDPQEKFNEELKVAAQQLGISFGEFSKPKKLLSTPSVSKVMNEAARPKGILKTSPNYSPNYSPTTTSANPYATSIRPPTPPRPKVVDTDYQDDDYNDRDGSEYNHDDDGYHDDADDGEHHDDDDTNTDRDDDDHNDKYPNDSYGTGASYNDANNYRFQTQEQQRREHIDAVIGNDGFSFEKEKREDLKCSMLAEIDELMSSLAEENINLSRIPKVNQTTPYAEVESVLKMLRHKNDHARYCSFAEEFLMFGAYAMEEVFDGKRVWLGRYSPDLTGWHNHVNIKLKRMRHDTGQLVSGIMQDYNIGPGARLLLELVPNMVLYSKLKTQQHTQPGLFTDDEMMQATQNIRNATED